MSPSDRHGSGPVSRGIERFWQEATEGQRRDALATMERLAKSLFRAVQSNRQGLASVLLALRTVQHDMSGQHRDSARAKESVDVLVQGLEEQCAIEYTEPAWLTVDPGADNDN